MTPSIPSDPARPDADVRSDDAGRRYDALWDALTECYRRGAVIDPKVRREMGEQYRWVGEPDEPSPEPTPGPGPAAELAWLADEIGRFQRNPSRAIFGTPSIADPSGLATGKGRAGIEVPEWFIHRLLELVAGPAATLDGRWEQFATGASGPDESANWEGPPRIGEYDILGFVGEGGMGAVFLAFSRNEGLRVESLRAVKLLSGNDIGHDPHLDEQFVREARILEGLNDDHIVRLYRNLVGQTPPHLVMEYVYGPTLEHLLRHRGGAPGIPLPVDLALDLLHQIATALVAIHRKDDAVVHRDLKPSNILLERCPVESHGWRAKIADFGLARRVPAGETEREDGGGRGTTEYMAPEAIGGESNIGPAVDVYALGLLAYEMTTGVAPFRGNDLDARRHRLREGRHPDPVRPHGGTLPRPVCELVHRMIAAHPADRPRIEEVLSDLKRIIERRSPVADARRRRRRALDLVQRRRRRLAGMAVAAVVFALLAVLGWSARRDARVRTLEREIDDGLPAIAAEDRQAARVRDRIAALAAYDRALADRKWVAFAGAIRERFGPAAPRLEAADVARLRGAIEVVRGNDPVVAGRLGSELDDRLSRFQPLWRWPGTAPAAEFPAEVGIDAMGLVVRPASGEPVARRVLTRSAGGRGGSRLSVTFDVGWADTAEVGLELDGEEAAEGYVFLLRPAPRPVAPDEGPPDAPATLRQAVRDGHEVALEVRYRGTTLGRFARPAVGLPPDKSLTLEAARNGGRLTFSIDGVRAAEFEDVFAAADAGPAAARFGLRWPPGVRVLGVRAERIAVPRIPSPLEEGDELFRRCRYRDANAAYGRIDVAGGAAGRRAEILFKRGLCGFRLNDPSRPTADLFRQALETGETVWRSAAYFYLWATHLRRGPAGRRDADALLDERRRYLPDLTLTSTVPRIAVADVTAIHDHLRELVTATHPDPTKTAQRIEQATAWTQVQEFLSGDSSESRLWLSRACSRAGQVEQALGALGANDPRRVANLSLVCERVWLLRQKQEGSGEALRRVFAEAEGYGRTPVGRIVLGVLRAECEYDPAALDQVANRERVRGHLAFLDGDREADPSLPGWVRRDWLPRAWLMRGFLSYGAGDRAGAKRDWRRASEAGATPAWRSGLLTFLIARSLSETTDATDVRALLFRLRDETDRSGVFQTVESLLTMERLLPRGTPGLQGRLAKLPPDERNLEAQLTRVAARMWRTEEGMKAARMHAFRAWSLRDQSVRPKTLAAAEFLRQYAFRESSDRDQATVTAALAERALELAGGGYRPKPEAVAPVWFGAADRAKVDAVFASLPPGHDAVRAAATYILAHRMLKLGHMTEASELLHRAGDEVGRLAGSRSARDRQLLDPLARLIAADRRLLADMRGYLTIEGRAGKAVVTRRSNGKSDPFEVKTGEAVALPAGTYELKEVGAAKANTVVTLAVGQRATVRLAEK